MTLRKLLILSLALLVAGPMEAQKKKKRPRKPAVEVPKEDPRITNMREMTQQILIIDSIVADKDQVLAQIHLSEDAGQLMTSKTFTGKAVSGQAFVNEMGNKAYLSLPDDSLKQQLYTCDLLGGEWSQPEALQGLNDGLFETSYAGPIASKVTEDLMGTQNGITVVYAMGDGSNRYCDAAQIRLYPGNKLTISVAQGSLSELEFIFDSNTPSNNLEVLSVKESNGTKAMGSVVTTAEPLVDGKWTGKASSVTIGLASGKHARIKGFKVKMAQTTAIDGVQTNTLTGKRVIYNLQGQRVANPTRGLYIVDGKKIFIQ